MSDFLFSIVIEIIFLFQVGFLCYSCLLLIVEALNKVAYLGKTWTID